MIKKNILIFPAGSENAINIYDSLKYSLHFNLFGASSVRDYAEEIYPKENYVVTELYIQSESFFKNFNEIIKNFDIDYIIPTHDVISLFLMEHEKQINAKVVCSPFETAKIANSKIEILNNISNKFYCPKFYSISDKNIDFPVFLKPNVGAGGKGAILVKNREELENVFKNNSDMAICEFLPGDELTIDCFTDKNGELLFIGPRTRERITMGISFTSKTIPLSSEIEDIANDLNSTFKFRGAWFFQVKKDINNNYKLMEFSVRQAGTMALYRQLGVNFALLSLFDAMDMNVKILFNNYNLKLNRRLANSYTLDYKYNKVYIDFDDTLIINNKINTTAVMFLYQCLNKNKKIILITKHSTEISDDLKKFHIDNTIFEKIYSLNESDNKSDYIDNVDSIFIDNYYKEREEVYIKLGIPVFDVDAIECLIDYSEV